MNAAVGQRQEVHPRVLGRHRARPLQEDDAPPQQLVLQGRRHLGVLLRQDLLAADDQRHLRPERREHVHELDAGHGEVDVLPGLGVLLVVVGLEDGVVAPGVELAHPVLPPLVEVDGALVGDLEHAGGVDGADEVDPDLNLIKGYGGALVRERIVAAASRRQIILATPEKLVQRLGSHGRLPVEVMPFALPLCRRRLDALGLKPELRTQEQRPFVTDNGNLILDTAFGSIPDARKKEVELKSIPGVLEVGLFTRRADIYYKVKNDGSFETITF